MQGAVLAAAVGTHNQAYSGTVVGVAQQAAGLMSMKYGRDDEREGDFYGTRYMAKAGYDPYAAVSLQEIFLRLSGDAKSSWMQGLLSSHPPSAERVSNNRGLVSQLRAEGFEGGEFGSDRFQSAIRPLRDDAEAYKAYDNAQQAFRDKDYNAALASLQTALDGQYEEAAFHGLRGDVRYRQKRYGDAITNYTRAIERHSDYFSYYLGRGMARSHEREGQFAKADLNRSVELLPTAVAYNELGSIAEREGNTAEAVRYYEAASKSSGETSRTAYSNMLRLDLPRQPARYVQARVTMDSENRLVLQVKNSTPVRLELVRLQVQLQGADGKTQRYSRTVERLDAQASVVLRLPDPGVQIMDAKVQAVAAQVSQ
jgi:predicted Zn-dependent protease